jgi:hypothetical protein
MVVGALAEIADCVPQCLNHLDDFIPAAAAHSSRTRMLALSANVSATRDISRLNFVALRTDRIQAAQQGIEGYRRIGRTTLRRLRRAIVLRTVVIGRSRNARRKSTPQWSISRIGCEQE